MAIAAETNNIHASTEQYFGYSLHTVGKYGAAICKAAGLEVVSDIEEELWQDFITGVQENVVISDQVIEDKRASAIREKLKFDPMRAMEVRGGHVVTKDGRPVVDLCWDGWEAAKKKEAVDSRMDSEVERSSYDVWVAQQVDKLEPGELIAVPSMEPLDAMDRDGDDFWKNVSIIGYARGLAVWQVYYKANNSTVLAGAYSVKGSSKNIFQKQLAGHGVTVPLSTPANQWILNPIRKRMSAEEALRFGPQLHDEYQQIAGRCADGVSVTQLMQDNEPLVRAYFNVYMKALAKAYYTGENNVAMQGLAAELLQSARLFSARDRQTMLRVANSENFTEQDALFMEKTVRYACAEELWALLLNGGAKSDMGFAVIAGRAGEYAAALHARAASRVHAGIVVGRFGGGCNVLRFERPDGGSDDDNDDLGQQGIFGGNAKEKADERPLACAYMHDQCYCSPYDGLANPRATRMLVIAYRDRKGIATCLRPRCGAKIDSKGEVLSKGVIYEEAQAKERARLDALAQQVLQPRPVGGLALRIRKAKQEADGEGVKMIKA